MNQPFDAVLVAVDLHYRNRKDLLWDPYQRRKAMSLAEFDRVSDSSFGIHDLLSLGSVSGYRQLALCSPSTGLRKTMLC